MLSDIGLLILRLVVGLLLVGHGAQKLFGWFGGPGLNGVTAWLGALGLRPARFWALMAGLSEFVGGVLLALGLLYPLGSLGIIGSMLVAILMVHRGQGLWNQNQGSELPLTNLAVALSLALTGPGAYALDTVLGIMLPLLTLWVGLVLVLLAAAVAQLSRATPAQSAAQ